jgi:hypothetical protein
MSLKDALDETIEVEIGCRVRNLKSKLSKEDLETLEIALKDDLITTASISRALKKEGHMISVHSLGRHRRGDCNCGLK